MRTGKWCVPPVNAMRAFGAALRSSVTFVELPPLNTTSFASARAVTRNVPPVIESGSDQSDGASCTTVPMPVSSVVSQTSFVAFRRISVAPFCTSTAASDVTTASFPAVPLPNVFVPDVHASTPRAVIMSFVVVAANAGQPTIVRDPSPVTRPDVRAVRSGDVRTSTGLPAVSVSTSGHTCLYPKFLISNTPPASGAKESSRSPGFGESKKNEASDNASRAPSTHSRLSAGQLKYHAPFVRYCA